MERRGLIAREECAEDGRGLMVRVTDAGRRAIEAAAPAHAENVQRYFFDQLSNDELDTLADVFDRLLDNLTRDSTCAPRRGPDASPNEPASPRPRSTAPSARRMSSSGPTPTPARP